MMCSNLLRTSTSRPLRWVGHLRYHSRGRHRDLRPGRRSTLVPNGGGFARSMQLLSRMPRPHTHLTQRMAVEVKKWRDVRQNTPSAAIVMDACSVLQRVRNPKARTDPLLGRTIRHVSDVSADVSRLMAFFVFSHVPSNHQLAPHTEARLAALTVGQLRIKMLPESPSKRRRYQRPGHWIKALRSLFRSEARIITRGPVRLHPSTRSRQSDSWPCKKLRTMRPNRRKSKDVRVRYAMSLSAGTSTRRAP